MIQKTSFLLLYVTIINSDKKSMDKLTTKQSNRWIFYHTVAFVEKD